MLRTIGGLFLLIGLTFFGFRWLFGGWSGGK